MILRRTLALAALLLASAAEAAGTPPPGCVGTNVTKTYAQVDGYDPTSLTTTAVYYSLTVPCYVTFNTDFVVTVSVRDELCNGTGATSYASPYTGPYTVGNHWNVTDTPDGASLTTIAGAGINGVSGYAGMKLAFDGTWVATVTQHYGPSGTAVNHLVGFKFIPREKDACYVGAMNWQPQWISTTVIDPYPEGTVVDPGPVTSTDPGTVGSTDPGPVASTDPGTTTSTGGSGGGATGTGAGDAPSGGASAAPPPSDSSGGCGSSGATPALLGLAALVAAAWPRRRARA